MITTELPPEILGAQFCTSTDVPLAVHTHEDGSRTITNAAGRQVGGSTAPIAPRPSLVERIAALKKATAARLIELAEDRKLATIEHKKNLKRIDDEVAALAPKQTRNRKPKAVAE